MSVLKRFQECTVVLNDLSKAAVNARSEVQKLLTVLEGPAVTDVQQKYDDDAPLDLNPALTTGSYIPHFADPAGRNPTYQSEYPQY